MTDPRLEQGFQQAWGGTDWQPHVEKFAATPAGASLLADAGKGEFWRKRAEELRELLRYHDEHCGADAAVGAAVRRLGDSWFCDHSYPSFGVDVIVYPPGIESERRGSGDTFLAAIAEALDHD